MSNLCDKWHTVCTYNHIHILYGSYDTTWHNHVFLFCAWMHNSKFCASFQWTKHGRFVGRSVVAESRGETSWIVTMVDVWNLSAVWTLICIQDLIQKSFKFHVTLCCRAVHVPKRCGVKVSERWRMWRSKQTQLFMRCAGHMHHLCIRTKEGLDSRS